MRRLSHNQRVGPHIVTLQIPSRNHRSHRHLGKPGIRGTEKRSQLTADIDADRLLWLGPVDDDFLDQLAAVIGPALFL
jgi:hypothetical protein